MGLDRYTNERLAYSYIADHQRLAEQLRTLDRLVAERRQERHSTGGRWFLHLLRLLPMGRVPDLDTLHRL